MNCYCKSGSTFSQCCEPFIVGRDLPTSPEQLMRSRYSAYCVKAANYIKETYAESQQAAHSIDSILEFADFATFVNLEIVQTDQDSEFAYVEFKAHYISGSTWSQLHERSRFIKEVGAWRYLDGELYPIDDIKLGRNSLCPCGNGKKFKRCHG